MPLGLHTSRRVYFPSAERLNLKQAVAPRCTRSLVAPEKTRRGQPEANIIVVDVFDFARNFRTPTPIFIKIWCRSPAGPTSPTPSSQCQVLAAITTPNRLKHAFHDQRMALNRGKSNAPVHSELVTTGTDVRGRGEGKLDTPRAPSPVAAEKNFNQRFRDEARLGFVDDLFARTTHQQTRHESRCRFVGRNSRRPQGKKQRFCTA